MLLWLSIFVRTRATESIQIPTTSSRRSPTLAHVATQIVASSRPPEKVVHKWKIFQAICGGTAEPRRDRASAAGLERSSPSIRDGADGRGRPCRFPLEPAPVTARARHAGVDVATPSRGPGRRGPRHPAGQPQRQALRAQRRVRRDRAGVRI